MAVKKAKQKHLGKGLQALLGPVSINEEVEIEKSALDEVKDSLRKISPADIVPNPFQPRTVWDEDALSELVESIKANGIIQPIVVRETTDGFQIIAGERRWRAAKIAELSNIPALVRKADDSEMMELALVENIHRSDLNPLERAAAYQDYVRKFNLTQAEASQRLGENRSVIANYMRLLDLPIEVKQMLENKELSMGHARAILALPTDDLRRKLANRALAGRLSVREVERLVRKHLNSGAEGKSARKEKPSHIMDLESKLREGLGTKVRIDTNKSGQKGRIVIDFYSLDEFDRLADKMGISFEGSEVI